MKSITKGLITTGLIVLLSTAPNLAMNQEVWDYTNKSVIEILEGISEDNFVIRTNIPGFATNDFITHLNKTVPEAQIDGGGHDFAGSVKFIEAAHDKILEELKKFISKL